MDFLKRVDPQIRECIHQEMTRQEQGLEMIASENYTSEAVMQAQGSILTNKYAEGYPQRRYYGGCQFIDKVEQIAIDRAKKLFHAEYANVQPHSGSQANMASYLATMQIGDTLMGMDLCHGGHLTHGSPVNFSGILFKVVSYGLDSETGLLNYDHIFSLAKQHRPKVLIAGHSAYPRILDFEKFKNIAESVGSTLIVDMSHFSGLVAGGVHPSPVGLADVVTTTTHKTLRGPRGGLILTQTEAHAKKINSKIFPGTQGGPLEHVIAAKAVAFHEAFTDDFKDYSQKIVNNAKALAEELLKRGFDLVTGGTDNHLLLMDLSSMGITGKAAEKSLDLAGITVNKNTVPNEKKSPFVTSGIRIGTPALTTRGMGVQEMKTIAGWIFQVLHSMDDKAVMDQVRQDVQELCKHFPVYSSIWPHKAT